jgi:tungstate transport system ATP-binding protein
VTPVFSLRQAGVRFGKGPGALQALCELDLHIAPGERVALIGANGCGKSTLLRLLHGLVPASSGQVGRDASVTHAMVFQRPYLLRASAQTNVALGLWLRGTRWKAAKSTAFAALQRVGLADHAPRPAHKLSGGQQQRVALARACAMQPRVLMLDEPTSSLDPHAKREVEALIQQFAADDPGMTLVFSSHNLGQVKRLATRVVYLEQGRILADLPVTEFFGSPVLQQQYPQAHAFVKGDLV